MTRWGVLLACAIVWVAGVGLVRHRGSDSPPVTVAGHVSMVTSLDGLTTAVSVDADGPAQLPDGLVDHAFRLQHKVPQVLAYDGKASLIFTETELRVSVEGQTDWLFSVEGTASATSALQPQTWLILRGLSHHWGGKIHASAGEVTKLLLAAGCTTEADPSCDSCEAGGPGVDGCGIECDGETGCSARCGSGLFACCNCPGGCRCCAANSQSPKVARR
jgi:hypothetical protein